MSDGRSRKHLVRASALLPYLVLMWPGWALTRRCSRCRAGDVVNELRRFSHADTMVTSGRVVGVLEANRGAKAVVDVIGLGSGVVDRLREQGFKRTVAFNASAGTGRTDRSGELRFVNLRAAAWWWLRENLDPAFEPALALPPDDLLIGDLVAPRYTVTSTGKIQVESKDEIRKRLGRSTDSGDAVVMACFDATRGIGAQYMDYMRAIIAEREENPPPPPDPMPPRTFLLGSEVPNVVSPQGCERPRFFGPERRCIVCGGQPTDHNQ